MSDKKNREFVQSHYEDGKLYNLEAVRLWLKGKDAWNKWVEENPECDVDFSIVDFSKIRGRGANEEIYFAYFWFPKGGVSFSEAQFGEGSVDFSNAKFGGGDVNFFGTLFGKGNVNFSFAQFGEGDVDFSKTRFGKGDVDFSYAQFGEGNVDFSSTQFGEGNVDFSKTRFWEGNVSFTLAQFGKGIVNFYKAQFGEGKVSFTLARFGEGNVLFSESRFGEGDVDFSHTQFGEGEVFFYKTRFGEGDVDFSKTQFREGNVDFSNTQFGEGKVSFTLAQFGEGNVNFSEAQFGEGNVDFLGAKFDEDVNFQLIQVGGNLILRELEESSEITSFLMKGASVDGLLSLSDNTFNCVPDLTETNIKHDVELQTLNVRLKRERLNRKGLWAEKSQDSRDIERLRKLKQIAENNKHHEAALRFHADEMRAKRWHKKEVGGFGFLGSVLDLLYSTACRYGQSIARPFIGLAITWCCFFAAFQYFIISQSKNTDWLKTAIFVISNSLPFISVAKEVRKDFSELYFAESMNLYYSLVITQAVFSLLFVFLIGLGLRNRFRL